jgi:hypothetical protein
MPPYLFTLCHLLLQSFSHSSCHTGGGGEEGGHGDLCAVRLRGDVGSQHRKGGGRACLRIVRHPCSNNSFGLSATSQQYFSLRTNQPPVLFSQNKSASASQTNCDDMSRRPQCELSLACWLAGGCRGFERVLGHGRRSAPRHHVMCRRASRSLLRMRTVSLSGILPGYSCKEGRRRTPTRILQ